jgi:hypothetical protein
MEAGNEHIETLLWGEGGTNKNSWQMQILYAVILW